MTELEIHNLLLMALTGFSFVCTALLLRRIGRLMRFLDQINSQKPEGD